MIQARALTKRYGGLTAIQNVSFEIAKGEVVGFLGPNAAGKTTTMRILTGYIPASSGSVSVGGFDVALDPRSAKRVTGYLPETPPLYPEMLVHEYLHYAATLHDVPRGERRDKVARAIASCGLEAVSERVIRTLSKGYRQRVGLAQAIVHDPAVLILDEPTAGLDPIQIDEIRKLITRLADEQGRTVILSTHIMGEVQAICKRVLLIAFGKLRLDAALDALQAQGSLEQMFLSEVEKAKREELGGAAEGSA
ncbi:MAG TPA: ATP-binding cassette domain-containing protein [Myxococcota bacterium]|nr:ATP-binding cassette domain-containing protein [Myxococcota bacterium]